MHEPIRVLWTTRPAALIRRGEEVSEIRWLDTKQTQAISNDQLGDHDMNFNEMKRAELTDQYNEMVLTAVDLGLTKFKSVKSFKDTPTAVQRCKSLHEEIQKNSKSAAKPTAAKPTAAKPTAAKKKPGAPRKSSVPDDGKIHILAKENPKRAKAAERFALYKEGMLVRTYVEKIGNNTLAYADLRWDIKMKFIRVD